MGLHANKENKERIEKVKSFLKTLAMPIINRIWKKYHKVVEKREEEGWKRTTTPKVKELLYRVTSGLGENRLLRKGVDFVIVIYDSDNAYADILHRFVEACNNQELVLEQGEMYMNYERGSEEWWESELEEQEHMSDEELENLKKRTKNLYT